MRVDTAKTVYRDIEKNKENFKSHWEDLSQFMAPTRGVFDKDKDSSNDRKKTNYKKLINNTVFLAIDTLAAGMLNGLTSPSREWFKLTTALSEHLEVAQWANEIKKKMEHIFQRSNFYNTLHNIYQELEVFGTGCFIIDHDFKNVINCTQFTINEYSIAYDTKGRPNIFGREFMMTAQQMVEDFGYENVSDSVRNNYDNQKYSTPYKVYHLICENKNRDKSKKDNKNFKYKSVYWQKGEDKFLKESGYNYFPVVAPRYAVNSSCDTYGYGIGDKVLGDLRQLQKMEQVKLIGLQKTVEPPLAVSSAVQGKINVAPNGITRFSGQTDSAIYSLYKGQIDLQSISSEIEKVQKRILNNFYYDVFLMLTSQEYARMTATEVAERHQEKLMMLGPVLQRLNSELLDPAIEITFNIMLEHGLIPEPPEILDGESLNVEYVSIIAQAQKAQGMSELNQIIAFVGQVAQVSPETLDTIDFDEAVYTAVDKIGADPKIMRSKQQVEAIRQQRALQQQKQQELANANAEADTMEKLSKANMSEENALTAITEGMQ